MKVFALLLSFLLFTSCSTPFGLHDWDGFLVGWGHPVEEFSSYGEEEVNEPQPIVHDIRIPYDFSFVERIDWKSYRPHVEDELPEPTIEAEEEIETLPYESIQEDDVLTGDDIVLLACIITFTLCVFVAAMIATRRRHDT